ncbi:hypothetical protein A2J03_02460 [Rhodococcus sp. EPR-157]|uniref:DUF3618 domain-containing protein n=1 Tax=Rhodococcus sp. EPR-157 TaxID=1813677 RepID=UPI0007BB7124|nr:DUF3618 domain-containing protein [Rhodococcus sp. EPR-157]KZF09402.1 hypothetical protein A2J03_02460 [Rhodococcus sp. EPR-157]
MTDKHADASAESNQTEPSVDAQRAELAETVSALAAKADVPTRVRNEATVQASKASDAVKNNPNIVAGIVGAVLTSVLVTVLLRRRRARRFLR